jgi:uncharacterized membrane protein YoaK (UPF0700 family)
MSRLSLPWVVAGGVALATLAAALNAFFVLQLGASVSHLTGDLAHFSIDLAAPRPESLAAAGWLAAALSGFTAGAIASGWFIHHPNLELSRPYGRSISSIGLLVLASGATLPHSPALALLLAGAACGFQNALATHFRGIILRTTHVTGLFTDLGVALGMYWRGREVDPWRIRVPLLLIGGFALGAAGGGYATVRAGHAMIFGLGALYLAGGLGWTIAKRRLPLFR